MQMTWSTYRNPTDQVIEFEIGTLPGSPPDLYRVEPGGVIDGPANYVKVFARHGLVLCEAKPADESTPAPSPSSDERGPGPTIEEWVDAGYPAAKYPPDGYDEVPSPGLTAYRQTGSLQVDSPNSTAAEEIAAELEAAKEAAATPGPDLFENEPEPEPEPELEPEPLSEPKAKAPKSRSKSKAKAKKDDE